MRSRFVCKHCRNTFSVPSSILAKYPGWKPCVCLKCKKKVDHGKEDMNDEDLYDSNHPGHPSNYGDN
jgi:hypothetical protein